MGAPAGVDVRDDASRPLRSRLSAHQPMTSPIALRRRGASLDVVSDDERVVLPDAEVIRLGFEDITYRVSGRRLTVPYTVVQPGSVIVLGARGPLILPKSVVEGL